ncbi:MAG: PIG-L deacetylase family protein, partial [Acidimicrobiales bacterium]
MIETSIPDRALAVFAHPDDPEVSCGGTLARWASSGTEIHLVIANRGDKGSADPTTDPDALSEHRAEEVA